MQRMTAAPHTRPADLRHLAMLAAGILAFVALTWGQWPMLTSDPARELYVPFHIRHGAVIYRDFLYLYGPVAPYLQAGLLTVFGDRLDVLYAASAVQLMAITGLLYAAARHVLSPRLALAVGGLFLTQYALGRDLNGYMWPYAFAATYGVLLGLATLVALLRHDATGRLGWLALAGAAAGLAMVTKLEYGAAAVGLAGAYLAGRLLVRARLTTQGPWWQEAAAVALPAAAMAGGVAGLVLAQVDWPTVQESVWPTRLMALWNSAGAWHGNAGSWKENLRWGSVAFSALALAAGHRRLWDGLKTSWGVRAAALATIAALVAFALGKSDRLPFIWDYAHRLWTGPGFMVLLGVVGWVGWQLAAAVRAGSPVPAGVVAWGLIAGYGLLAASRTVLTGMNEYIGYQGPAALVAWVALGALWLPAWLGTPASKQTGQALALALLVFVAGRNLLDAARTYGGPQVVVTGPAGSVLAPPAFGAPFGDALAWLRAHRRPGEQVVAGPMEASVYLMLGLRCPVPEIQFFYGYLIEDAEQRDFMARLQRAHVRWFVLSNYGFGELRFGRDYARTLGAWLHSDGRRAASFGQKRPGKYYLEIWELPVDAAGAGYFAANSGETPPLRMISR